MQKGAGDSEKHDQGTDALVVANLFAELERICADGSWEMPESPATKDADRGEKPGPRSRFWRWL